MSRTQSLRIGDYLGHIVEAIERIERYVQGMDLQSFLDDENHRMPSSGILKLLAKHHGILNDITESLPRLQTMCGGR